MFNRDEYDFFLKDDAFDEDDGVPKELSLATPSAMEQRKDDAIERVRDLLQKRWAREAVPVRN